MRKLKVVITLEVPDEVDGYQIGEDIGVVAQNYVAHPLCPVGVTFVTWDVEGAQ